MPSCILYLVQGPFALRTIIFIYHDWTLNVVLKMQRAQKAWYEHETFFNITNYYYKITFRAFKMLKMNSNYLNTYFFQQLGSDLYSDA